MPQKRNHPVINRNTYIVARNALIIRLKGAICTCGDNIDPVNHISRAITNLGLFFIAFKDVRNILRTKSLHTAYRDMQLSMNDKQRSKALTKACHILDNMETHRNISKKAFPWT